MWIKLTKNKSIYLFEKKPPPDTTFEDFQRKHRENLMWQSKQAKNVARELTQNIIKQHVKLLTADQAADILGKIEVRPPPGADRVIGNPFTPKTIADWIGTSVPTCASSCNSCVSWESKHNVNCGPCFVRDCPECWIMNRYN